MSLHERVERFSEDREQEQEQQDSATVSPENCCHPHPSHLSVNTYVEDLDGKVEVEMECSACESLVYEVLEMNELLARKART